MPHLLTGNVVVPIEDDLSGKRWMPTNLDREVAPLGIPDMKSVVVHPSRFGLDIDAAFTIAFDLSHRA